MKFPVAIFLRRCETDEIIYNELINADFGGTITAAHQVHNNYFNQNNNIISTATKSFKFGIFCELTPNNKKYAGEESLPIRFLLIYFHFVATNNAV